MELETDAPQGEPQAAEPAPVESTTEATTEQPTSTETEAQPDTGEAASEERVKREPWFTKRIAEVTRQKYEAQREAEALRAQLAQQPQPQAQTSPDEPTLDDYNWDEAAFKKAHREWARADAKTAVREELAAERAEQQQQTRMSEIQGKLAEGTAKHSDFMDAAQLIPNTEPVMDFLSSVPGAVDVLYEVGKNPVEADRIFSLSPYMQAVELGKLAARLETPKATSRTIAPPPPQTVAGMAAGLAKSPADMSPAEYQEWYRTRDA
jgi:chromosome segregation ATPase